MPKCSAPAAAGGRQPSYKLCYKCNMQNSKPKVPYLRGGYHVHIHIYILYIHLHRCMAMCVYNCISYNMYIYMYIYICIYICINMCIYVTYVWFACVSSCTSNKMTDILQHPGARGVWEGYHLGKPRGFLPISQQNAMGSNRFSLELCINNGW